MSCQICVVTAVDEIMGQRLSHVVCQVQLHYINQAVLITLKEFLEGKNSHLTCNDFTQVYKQQFLLESSTFLGHACIHFKSINESLYPVVSVVWVKDFIETRITLSLGKQ